MSNGQHSNRQERNGQHRRLRATIRRAVLLTAAAGMVAAGAAVAPAGADPRPAGGPAESDSLRASAHPTPADAIKAAEHRLDVLNRQGEIASEAYNTVKVRLDRAATRLSAMRADLQRQQDRVTTLRAQIVNAALSDFQSTSGLSTSASFLVAKRPSEFIDSLATEAVVENRQAALLTSFQQQRNMLGVQEQQATRTLASITADRRDLGRHKAALDARVAQTKELLGHLRAKQRQRLRALQRQAEQVVPPASRDAARPAAGGGSGSVAAPRAPVSGRAAIAVATALAQIGKPYAYGAAGPYSFDCSGLTMYAWRAAGVSLSHASSVQSQQGMPVSLSDLQPGDLVFYYSPVSHVGMYIGNGMIVHAPHPGASVEVVPLYSMPVAWARRVG